MKMGKLYYSRRQKNRGPMEILLLGKTHRGGIGDWGVASFLCHSLRVERILRVEIFLYLYIISSIICAFRHPHQRWSFLT